MMYCCYAKALTALVLGFGLALDGLQGLIPVGPCAGLGDGWTSIAIVHPNMSLL